MRKSNNIPVPLVLLSLKDRKFLEQLRSAAMQESNVKNLSESWKRVYLRLADSANTLDAFIARVEAQITARK